MENFATMVNGFYSLTLADKFTILVVSGGPDYTSEMLAAKYVSQLAITCSKLTIQTLE